MNVSKTKINHEKASDVYVTTLSGSHKIGKADSTMEFLDSYRLYKLYTSESNVLRCSNL